MPFTRGYDAVQVHQLTDRTFMLTEPLRYQGRADLFEIPAGYLTDFATVPRVAVWLIPPFGTYTPAAVLHDWLLTDALPAGLVGSRDVDGLFRRVLRELQVPPVRRWLMWAGVRWGALGKPLRRPGWWRDAPAVLGISAAAAVVVIPPAVAISVGLVLYGLAESAAALVTGRRPPVPDIHT